jgi:hypothetical protein
MSVPQSILVYAPTPLHCGLGPPRDAACGERSGAFPAPCPARGASGRSACRRTLSFEDGARQPRPAMDGAARRTGGPGLCALCDAAAVSCVRSCAGAGAYRESRRERRRANSSHRGRRRRRGLHSRAAPSCVAGRGPIDVEREGLTTVLRGTGRRLCEMGPAPRPFGRSSICGRLRHWREGCVPPDPCRGAVWPPRCLQWTRAARPAA